MANVVSTIARAILLLLVPSGGFAQSVTYFNELYRFGIRLPTGYLTEDKAERSETGITLRSLDGKVVATISGIQNGSRKSISKLITEYKLKAPQARFTYEWRRANVVVLSGYEAEDIFYIRIALSDDRERAAILSMTYARDVKRRLDPLVSELSTSLFID